MSTDDALSYITVNNGTTTLNAPDNGTWGYSITLVARRVGVATAESGMWEIKGVMHRSGTGAASFVGTPTINEVAKSTGFEPVVAMQAMGNGFYIRITGETGKTINWVATLDVIQVIG